MHDWTSVFQLGSSDLQLHGQEEEDRLSKWLKIPLCSNYPCNSLNTNVQLTLQIIKVKNIINASVI